MDNSNPLGKLEDVVAAAQQSAQNVQGSQTVPPVTLPVSAPASSQPASDPPKPLDALPTDPVLNFGTTPFAQNPAPAKPVEETPASILVKEITSALEKYKASV